MVELIRFFHPKHGEIDVIKSTSNVVGTYFIADQIKKLIGTFEDGVNPDELIRDGDFYPTFPQSIQLYADYLMEHNNFDVPCKIINGLVFLRFCKNAANPNEAYEIFEWLEEQVDIHHKNGTSIYEFEDFRDMSLEDRKEREKKEQEYQLSSLQYNYKQLIKNNDKLYQRILKLKARVKELESKLNIISEDGE